MIKSENCIGCQACVDLCPAKAIKFSYNTWGEGRAAVNSEQCVQCGLCERICPASNQSSHSRAQTVMAAVSARSQTGSSGGVFFELASAFLKEGGIVYGAAFDKDLKLIHQKATSVDELKPLCKSKYLHSDMTGVFADLKQQLAEGRSVLFVGTPCQVSAVKNAFGKKYADQLLLIDFLCHGTGTQKVFDACIAAEGKKQNGKISAFSFRSKSRKAEHSFTYTLQKGKKTKEVSGYAFEFPYYYSFLKYTIFQDACYQCPYAKEERVGDITLGDFWGIGKYNPRLSAEKGVSMIAVHTDLGEKWFSRVEGRLSVCEQHPAEHAVSNNQSFYECEPYPKTKTRFASILKEQGEADLVQAMSCPNVRKHIIYAKCPKSLIRIYHKLRGKA